MSKNEIISKIYNDPSGFSSMKTTLGDAKKVDRTITIDDVKKNGSVIMFKRRIS